MAVTAIVSLKGGTGKTTTALNLGASLALKGHPVLLVDLDPQASLTYALQFPRHDAQPTVADVLLGGETVHDVIWKSPLENVYLCPSDLRLLELHAKPKTMKRAAKRLAANLRSVKRKNSHVIVDCPPALSPVTLMALRSADYILIPTIAAPIGTQALRDLLGHLEATRKGSATRPRLAGILVTMFNPYLRLSIDTLQELRASFGKDVLQTVIRQTVRLAEAPARGQSIFQYAPSCPGAESYHRLRKEFLKRTRS